MEENRKTQTPEENGGEKLFTQDDVNRIISERLAREREKPRDGEREAALNEREKALEAREALIACRDFASTLKIRDAHKGILLDALDTTDVEKFKAAANKLIEGLHLTYGPIPAPPAGTRKVSDRIADAFKPKI